MNTMHIDNCLKPSSEQEEFLKFHYRNPQIYVQLKKLAKQEKENGEKSLDIFMLLAKINDIAIEKMKKDEPKALVILSRYRILLETDFDLWSMFHSGN